jgi:hypothetical protein
VTLHDVTRAVVALVASGALWLVVSGDERGAAWVPVSLELSSGVAAIVPPSQPVRALVSGRRRDFIRLLQSPPVLRRTLAREIRDMRDSIMPDGIVPDRVRVELRPMDVTLPNGTEARVSDLHPRSLVVPLPPEPRT